jgi:RND family efflux transporter MFP subunit
MEDEANPVRWKGVAAVVLLVVAVAGITVAVTSALSGPTIDEPTYLTAAASLGDVAETVVATGNLERGTAFALTFGDPPTVVGASGATGSGATEAWRVDAVAIAEGELVTADQVLATADTAAMRRDLNVATAQLRAARSERSAADQQLDDAPTTLTRRQARMTQESADSRIASAHATVAELKDRIARSTLVAPANGVVTDVAIAPGANAPAGAAITVATGPIRATAGFAEGDLASLAVGQPASVTVDAIGETLAGTVAAIAPEASEAAGSAVVTFIVTIDLISPPADARAGMTAEVTVTSRTASAVVTVPAAALNGSDGAYTVLVIGPDDVALERAVEVGLVTAESAEISSGLDVGEAVVIGTDTSRDQPNGFQGGGQDGADGPETTPEVRP